MPKDRKVTATLLKFDCIFEGKDRIRAKCSFELTKTNVNTLHGMREFYVGLEESDRGAPRKALPEFSGKILDIVIPKAPKKEGKIILEFPDSDLAVNALRQIREAEPPTVNIVQLEQALDLEEEEESDQEALAGV